MRSTELLLLEKRYNTTNFFFKKKCYFPHNISELGLRNLCGENLT
jgi:hypothetical protein